MLTSTKWRFANCAIALDSQ